MCWTADIKVRRVDRTAPSESHHAGSAVRLAEGSTGLIPPQDLDDFMNFTSDSWPVLLDALHQAAGTWHTPAQIATDLGWDPETTTDLLADLDVAGLVDVRELRNDLVVSLSERGRRAIAAHRSPALEYAGMA